MKKIICIFFTILAVLPLNIKAYDSSATSAILMDIDSKRIIYAKNILPEEQFDRPMFLSSSIPISSFTGNKDIFLGSKSEP